MPTQPEPTTTIYEKATLQAMTDRQLDGVVATVVMGWDVVGIREDCSQFTPGGSWDHGADGYTIAVPYYYDAEGNAIEEHHPPMLATTWDGMRLIIERMLALGRHLWITKHCISFNDDACDDHGSSTYHESPADFPRCTAIAAVLALAGPPTRTWRDHVRD